jgi:catechol 2,3-dioxygenase-like lactoylglutathione lyase family enzyme
MINGAHVIVYSTDADADRAFIRDVLGFAHVDAGDGWLIFKLPPAEAAVHPGDESRHEFYLMCDDLDATLGELGEKGVELAQPVVNAGWGSVAAIRLPSGSALSLYQPRHPVAHDL